MNPFTHSRPSRNLMPERVTLPNVDQEEVDALQHELDFQVRSRLGFLLAMRAKGAVPFVGARSKRKRRKPTKHVRHMRDVAARAYTLQGRDA